MAEYVVACMQADRSGRAEEYADAYNESELAAENNNQMVAGRMESRVSITTIQACFTPPTTAQCCPFSHSACFSQLYSFVVVQLPVLSQQCCDHHQACTHFI